MKKEEEEKQNDVKQEELAAHDTFTIIPTPKQPTEAELILQQENAFLSHIDSDVYGFLNLGDFMHEPLRSDPLQRPCVAGEANCILVLQNKGLPPGDGLPPGYIVREFYLPRVWKKIVADQQLPEAGSLCYYCKKDRAERSLMNPWRCYNCHGDLTKKEHRDTNTGDNHTHRLCSRCLNIFRERAALKAAERFFRLTSLTGPYHPTPPY